MKKIIGVFVIALAITSMASAQDTTTKEMTGRYKFPAGSVIEEAIVTWENGVLSMRSTAGVSVLEKMKGDTFNVVSFSGICVFKRGDAKKITGVHVDASGYILDGEKDPDNQLQFAIDTEASRTTAHAFIQDHFYTAKQTRNAACVSIIENESCQIRQICCWSCCRWAGACRQVTTTQAQNAKPGLP